MLHRLLLICFALMMVTLLFVIEICIYLNKNVFFFFFCEFGFYFIYISEMYYSTYIITFLNILFKKTYMKHKFFIPNGI